MFKILPLLLLGDWGLKKALRIAIGNVGNDSHLGPGGSYYRFSATPHCCN
jgi:hypothetical protein